MFTILAKMPIRNVWLSSKYGYNIYIITDFKEMTPHVLLKFYKFY